jgi:hypothetical protein
MLAVRARIDRWRQTRTGVCPMPSALWASATELVGRHGLYATARGLGVDYGTLGRRVKNATSSDSPTVGFIEWNGAEILGAGLPAGTVVEIADRSGRQVTVRLAAGERVDVAGIVAAFCHSGQA